MNVGFFKIVVAVDTAETDLTKLGLVFSKGKHVVFMFLLYC